jgi:hypothetical protein
MEKQKLKVYFGKNNSHEIQKLLFCSRQAIKQTNRQTKMHTTERTYVQTDNEVSTKSQRNITLYFDAAVIRCKVFVPSTQYFDLITFGAYFVSIFKFI